MEIVPAGVELFQADRRTDMTTVIVAFRNFANAPKTAIKIKGEKYIKKRNKWRSSKAGNNK
jgi:hypothetical protein